MSPGRRCLPLEAVLRTEARGSYYRPSEAAACFLSSVCVCCWNTEYGRYQICALLETTSACRILRKTNHPKTANHTRMHLSNECSDVTANDTATYMMVWHNAVIVNFFRRELSGVQVTFHHLPRVALGYHVPQVLPQTCAQQRRHTTRTPRAQVCDDVPVSRVSDARSCARSVLLSRLASWYDWPTSRSCKHTAVFGECTGLHVHMSPNAAHPSCCFRLFPAYAQGFLLCFQHPMGQV